jgi:hypothetical protein
MKNIQTIFTVVSIGLTLICLYEQYRIQWDKVKMNLFDKRFKVFSQVEKFILTGSKEGGTKLEIVQDFLSNIPEHNFIFGNHSEIPKYIDDLWRRGLTYSRLREQSNDLNSFPYGSTERKQLIDEIHPHMEFFTSEVEMVKYKFSKYLHLGEVEERNFLSKFFGKTRK